MCQHMRGRDLGIQIATISHHFNHGNIHGAHVCTHPSQARHAGAFKYGRQAGLDGGLGGNLVLWD